MIEPIHWPRTEEEEMLHHQRLIGDLTAVLQPKLEQMLAEKGWEIVDAGEVKKLQDRIAELESMLAVHRLAVDVDALKARIAELEAALKPFADEAQFYHPMFKDEELAAENTFDFTIGDIRAARAAYLGEKND